MSTIDADDLEATGYLLSEDSRLRLKKLHDYVTFLADLVRPRTSDGRQAWTVEIRAGEVATCMELLAEQIGQVLDELCRLAERGHRAAAQSGDAVPAGAEAEATQAEAMEPEAAGEEADGAGARYLFGVTLDQIDEINLLLDMIRAHGDVVVASHEAEFADHTLSLVGHAIFCDAQKLRDIIRDVDAQQLGPTHGARTGVREEPAIYHVLPARLPVGRESHAARQLPTYQ